MSAAWEWLEPIRTSVPELSGHDWTTLLKLSDALARRAASAPTPADSRTTAEWLLETRASLAADAHRAPAGPAGWAW